MSFGILSTFAAAYFIRDWRTLAALAAIPPTFNFILILFVPDSPYWLVENGEEEKAKDALVWLRGAGSECDRVRHMESVLYCVVVRVVRLFV